VPNVRLIARLDIKGPNLIKGVHLEGLRVIGDPQEYARMYYEQGADELVYIDIVASLYGRSKLTEIVRRAAHDVFVPMTVGGGIRNVDDVGDLLRAGADKVAINTAAVRRPELVTEVSRRYGSQAMVLSIEAKQQAPGKWEVYTDCGRERSGVDAIEWARRGVGLGAGEHLRHVQRARPQLAGHPHPGQARVGRLRFDRRHEEHGHDPASRNNARRRRRRRLSRVVHRPGDERDQ